MTLVELVVIALIGAATIILAMGHQGGRFFNWLLDHKPAQAAREQDHHDPAHRDRRHLLH